MEDDKTRRVKSLLSSYYTADDDSDAAGRVGGAGKESTSNPDLRGSSTNLNSERFDLDAYYRNLLSKTVLRDLIERERALQSEVKTYDGDMQMLVYENYNKFISATDTIRSMRSKVDDMESKMRKLQTSIDCISDANEAVDVKMLERRTQFDELNNVRAVMRKLRHVFDLPKKVEIAIENGAVEVAARYLSTSMPFLMPFSSGTLVSVRTQLQAHAKRVVAILKEKISSNSDDCADAINLLKDLDEPVSELEAAFAQSAIGSLRKAASDVRSGLANTRLMKAGVANMNVFLEDLSKLESNLGSNAAKLCLQYESLFSKSSLAVREEVDLLLSEVLREFKRILVVSVDAETMDPSPYIDLVTKFNQTFANVQASLGPAHDVASAAKDCVESSVRNYVRIRLSQLEQECTRILDGALDSSGEFSEVDGRRFDQAIQTTLEHIHTLLVDGRDLLEDWKHECTDLVREGVFHMALSLYSYAQAMQHVCATSVLHLYMLMDIFRSKVVPNTDALMQNMFPSNTSNDSVGRRLTSSENKLVMGLPRSLLQNFVTMEGRQMSTIVRNGMSIDWATYSPGEVSHRGGRETRIDVRPAWPPCFASRKEVYTDTHLALLG